MKTKYIKIQSVIEQCKENNIYLNHNNTYNYIDLIIDNIQETTCRNNNGYNEFIIKLKSDSIMDFGNNYIIIRIPFNMYYNYTNWISWFRFRIYDVEDIIFNNNKMKTIIFKFK